MSGGWQTVDSAPSYKEVLTFRSAGLMAVAVKFADGWWVSDGCQIIDVTHWMPLPDSPEQVKK